MKREEKQAPSGKGVAGLASLIGLALVWSIVWANLPSREELLSAQRPVAVAPAVPELDLSIPGVPAKSLPLQGHQIEPPVSGTTGAVSLPREVGAKQSAEVICEAEGQKLCPNSLTEEARRQCMAQRMNQLSKPCQRIARQQTAR